MSAPPAAREPGSGQPAFPARLLVVDDEEAIARIFRRRFEKMGWETITATSGEEALSILETSPIDLLLTDITMPQMNGIELMRKALALRPDLQCIVMTGFGQIETAVEAMRLGAINYFSKPIDFESLVVAISNGLEKKRLQAELARERQSLQRANRELALEVSKNKMILDAAGDGIIGFDEADRVTFANPAACRMLGWEADGLMGQSLSSVLEEAGASAGEGGKEAAEAVCRHRQGHCFPVEYVLSPMAENGRRIGSVLVFSDIAERRQAERNLLAHLDFLQVLLDTIPTPVFYKDTEGIYRGCNSAFARFVGKTAKEIIGKGVFDTFPRTNAERYHQADAALFASPGSQVYEAPLRYAGGSERQVVFHKATFTDPDGRVAGLVGIMLDITERKQAESELRLYRDRLEKLVAERTAELQKANDHLRQEMRERQQAEQEAESRRQQLIEADKLVSLGVLVAGVAHEINNPNTFIMMNAPILRRAWEDTQPLLDGHRERCGDFLVSGLPYSEMRGHIPELFSGITEGAERIKQIVLSLKDYARKDVADLNQHVQINEVLKAALTLLANALKKATHRLEVAYGEGLPPVTGNFQRIEQVLINVIQNAYQALRGTDKGIAIASIYDPIQRVVTVRVQDEGCGIPPNHLKHIKDPFFTTKRDSGGTGLGL
ncbi:MAG: PAS domain S-box protein [Desulfobacteraceae bacterium]|nr:PAS domain S-box protein [Desulfobacteraceae bacterium]